jgi:hypothetical protein
VSASQRRKGAVGEREAASLMRQVYPGAMRSASQAGRTDEADVEGTPWWVEVKVGARPMPLAALRQAEDATDGRPALVMARQDRQGWTVTMRWPDFARLVAEGEAARAAAVAMARADTERPSGGAEAARMVAGSGEGAAGHTEAARGCGDATVAALWQAVGGEREHGPLRREGGEHG